MEDAGEGAGGVDEEFATLLVDGDREVWVLGESGGLGLELEDAKDETIAADGVHYPGGLEVVDGLLHESDLGVGVDEVLERVVLNLDLVLFFIFRLLLLLVLSPLLDRSARRATRANHDTDGNFKLRGNRGQLLDGGRKATFIVRAWSVELDAFGTHGLSLETGGATEDCDFAVQLG